MDHIIPKYVKNPGMFFAEKQNAPAAGSSGDKNNYNVNKLIESPRWKMMSEGRSTRLGVGMGGYLQEISTVFWGKVDWHGSDKKCQNICIHSLKA